MKWSFRIATVSGIPVFVHGTFLLLLGFILVNDLAAGLTLRAALGEVVFLLVVFSTVVAHEFGHALTARRFGIRTKDITLLPIGGLARLERIPDIPRQELWVALAGPAVNIVLAGATFVAMVVAGFGLPSPAFNPTGGDAVSRFVTINLWLALFNLIPAFPMDGGRALRALLAERYEYARATEIAATLGQGLALVFGFIGLFTNPFLLFIALFVWMGATAEASMVTVRTALAGIPVGRAMITDFRVLEAHDSLQRAADLVVAGSQQDFPVVDGDRVVGVLTRDALIGALAQQGSAAQVGGAMTVEFERADAREMLEQAFTRLETCRCPVLPVLLDGRLVGLLTRDNVGEFVSITGALARRQA